MTEELFELELLGGASERAYRRARPEVEALPWDTLDPRRLPRRELERARQQWTLAALQEYASAANIALTLHALLRARAPLDLTANLSRFALDEITHAELCARVAGALGGGVSLRYARERVLPHGRGVDDPADPLELATVRVVRDFCVGETLSLELLRAGRRAAREPLLQGVFARLVIDESEHAAFGWRFVDWALATLDRRARPRVRQAALRASADAEQLVAAIAAQPSESLVSRVGVVGVVGRDAYVDTARRALAERIRPRLRRRRLG
jgi:hypothetical protein